MDEMKELSKTITTINTDANKDIIKDISEAIGGYINDENRSKNEQIIVRIINNENKLKELLKQQNVIEAIEFYKLIESDIIATNNTDVDINYYQLTIESLTIPLLSSAIINKNQNLLNTVADIFLAIHQTQHIVDFISNYIYNQISLILTQVQDVKDLSSIFKDDLMNLFNDKIMITSSEDIIQYNEAFLREFSKFITSFNECIIKFNRIESVKESETNLDGFLASYEDILDLWKNIDHFCRFTTFMESYSQSYYILEQSISNLFYDYDDKVNQIIDHWIHQQFECSEIKSNFIFLTFKQSNSMIDLIIDQFQSKISNVELLYRTLSIIVTFQQKVIHTLFTRLKLYLPTIYDSKSFFIFHSFFVQIQVEYAHYIDNERARQYEQYVEMFLDSDKEISSRLNYNDITKKAEEGRTQFINYINAKPFELFKELISKTLRLHEDKPKIGTISASLVHVHDILYNIPIHLDNIINHYDEYDMRWLYFLLSSNSVDEDCKMMWMNALLKKFITVALDVLVEWKKGALTDLHEIEFMKQFLSSLGCLQDHNKLFS